MHANLEQLMSLRDEEPVALEVREHVRGCEGAPGLLNELAAARGLVSCGSRIALAAAGCLGSRISCRRPGALPSPALAGAAGRGRRAGGVGGGRAAPAEPRSAHARLHGCSPDHGHGTDGRGCRTRGHQPAAGPVPVPGAGGAGPQRQCRAHARERQHRFHGGGTGRSASRWWMRDRAALRPAAPATRDLVLLWKQRVDLLQSLAAVRYAQVADRGI